MAGDESSERPEADAEDEAETDVGTDRSSDVADEDAADGSAGSPGADGPIDDEPTADSPEADEPVDDEDPGAEPSTGAEAADEPPDGSRSDSDPAATDPTAEGSTDAGPTDDDPAGAPDTNDAAEADPASTESETVAEEASEADASVGEEASPVVAEPDESTTTETTFGGISGPEEDREMPLADHIEEMVKRLAVVIAVAGLVSLFVFPVADQVINFLWYSIMPGAEGDIARPRLYGVLELWFTRIKVASLAGLIVALPVLVYQTYAFMRPGLYPHERRYYLAAVPTSLVLALVGVSFAYFIVLPVIFSYFFYYTQGVANIGFALGRTFDLILLLMGYLAIVFQIPLFIMLAMMMGLTSRQWLAERRILFWGAFLGISFIFSPDPTGMAPILVAVTMILLFEGTLLLTKWTGRA